MKKILTLLLLTSLMTTGMLSCKSTGDLSPAEKASYIIGLPVPLPGYLPEGYEIRDIQVEGEATHENWNITVFISDSEDLKSSDNITMSIRWFSPGMKLVNVERVAIGEHSAIVFREPDYIRLLWSDSESRAIELRGNARLEFDELVKIAESVTTPPRDILDVSIEPEGAVTILRNESKQLSVHLENNSINNLKVYLERDDELPESIRVNLPESSINLKPGEHRDVAIQVEIGPDTPSPVWQYRTASEVFPEDEPPPHFPVLEEPSYRLNFTWAYEMNGTLSRKHNLSREIRIDNPTVLPAGMVSLVEAENAAVFPVGSLLPSYLPEGINPPPAGYEITGEAPYCITAHYPDLKVVLCPEPGISAPPEEITGERVPFHNKTMVLGQGRVDWWIYDMHFSVISTTVPMDELVLVAKSMMQVGPFSESWLDWE